MYVVAPGVEFRRGFRAELENGRIEIGAGSVFTYYVLMQCSTSIEMRRLWAGEGRGLDHAPLRYRVRRHRTDVTPPPPRHPGRAMPFPCWSEPIRLTDRPWLRCGQ